MNASSFEVEKPGSRKSKPGLLEKVGPFGFDFSHRIMFQISPNVVTGLTTPLRTEQFMAMSEM